MVMVELSEAGFAVGVLVTLTVGWVAGWVACTLFWWNHGRDDDADS
jgi:hypothetical protein